MIKVMSILIFLIFNRVLIYLVWPLCIEFVITCLFPTQFTYVIFALILVLLNTRCFVFFTLPGLLPSISY